MFADALAAAMPELRRQAESLMLDTFVAYVPVPDWENPDTGMIEPGLAPAYETPGKVQGRSRNATTDARTETVGGVERVVVEGGLHIPYAAALPARDWVFECVEVGDPLNEFRIGRRWLVVGVPLDDATARRLDVVELPEEAP